MKRKEAIKQIQEGKIQVYNDLLPSTKEIKKFLKEAFPEDEMEENNTYILNEFFRKDSVCYRLWFSSNNNFNLPVINISTITKRKKTKLSQLEKQFSELAKDVVELRQTIAKDVEVIEEEIQQETIKEEEIDFSVPQLLIYEKEEIFVLMTNGISKDEYFEAYVVLDKKKKSGCEIGSFSDKWEKECYKLFKGELTIK